MKKNIVLQTDSYKPTHFPMYPPGTEYVMSYMESRGGRFPTTTQFGLQYLLKEHLVGQVVTEEKVKDAYAFFMQHYMNAKLFNLDGWMHIVKDHGGRLPVVIRAVPEGMTIPVSNVLMTVENTCPKCFWVPNYLETLLLRMWYPTTVCTLSREIKKVILKFLDTTGDPGLIDYKLHDFGYRGVSSEESAAIGGAAHLVNFKGTDTIAGIRMLQENYLVHKIGEPLEMPGTSIPASEHSTITAWGVQHEDEAYKNILERFPEGMVAIVVDSYDTENAVANILGTQLRQMIEERKGTVVFRPDSGDPAQVVLKVVQILAEHFGSETNSKGYEVLNPKVRVIQGDGVNIDSIRAILQNLLDHGFSADNVAFGMGGALLQQVNRDTQKFAFKACNLVVDGKERPVYKRPSLDKSKASKAGRLMLNHIWEDRFTTTAMEPGKEYVDDVLEEVFRDGAIVKGYNLKDIRERAWRT